MADSTGRFRLAVRKGSYETAAGKGVSSSDRVHLAMNIGGNPHQLTLTYIAEQAQQTDSTKQFLIFGATQSNPHALYNALAGTAVGFIVYEGSDTTTVLFEHAVDTAHWVAWVPTNADFSDEVLGNASDIERLQRVTGDILLGVKSVPGWGLVNVSGAEGGLYKSNTPSLAVAKAATYSAPGLDAGSGGSFFTARIPAGADPRHYAMREPSRIFGEIDTPLNEINHIGGDDDWDYYENDVRFFGNITLWKSGHTVGVNTWDGRLGPNALASIPGGARFWRLWSDETTPAIATSVSGSRTIASSSAAWSKQILDLGTVTGLVQGPLRIDVGGEFRLVSTAGNRNLFLEVCYELFSGDDAILSCSGTFRGATRNLELTVPANVFSTWAALVVGLQVEGDGGETYTIEASDFMDGIPVKVHLRVSGFDNAASDDSGSRAALTLGHLNWADPQFVVWQP